MASNASSVRFIDGALARRSSIIWLIAEFSDIPCELANSSSHACDSRESRNAVFMKSDWSSEVAMCEA